MTKLEEMSILADTIQRLGSDSYLGSWLAGSLPTLADWIRQDIIPPSVEELQLQASTERRHAQSFLENSRKEYAATVERCAEMRREAVSNGYNEAQAIKERARRALMEAIG